MGPAAVSRRVVLHGAAAGALGVALVGCGSDEPAGDAGSPSPATSAAESPTPSQGESTQGSGGGDEALVATNDVPVEGGVVIDDEVVVTQPESGTFKAFTAVCTHQGCIVNEIADNVITCPCHGSQYSASDGSVEGGPAPAPLAEVDVKVVDGQVVRA